MKLSYVKEHFKNNRRIAEALNITPQAVGLWPVDKIPELRAYQLEKKKKKQKEQKAKLDLALSMIEAGTV